MKNLFLIGLLLLTGTLATQAASIKATVRSVTGDATVTLPGHTHAVPLVEGSTLPSGSVITTGPGAEVIIVPYPGSSALIKENSEVSIDHVTYTTSGATVQNRAADLGLHLGTMTFAVDPGMEDVTDFKIHAGGAVAAARGCSATFVVTTRNHGFDKGIITGGKLVVKYGGTTYTFTGGSYFTHGSYLSRAFKAEDELVEEAEAAVFTLVKAGANSKEVITEMQEALEAVGIHINADVLRKFAWTAKNTSDTVAPTQHTIDESSQRTTH